MISQKGGSFDSETLALTIGLNKATSGTYQIGEEEAQTFTTSTTITIGSGMAYDESVTIKLTATDGTQTVTESYIFTKVKSVIDGSYDIYFIKPDSWGNTINCYAYVDGGGENATWPGVAMVDLGNDIYAYNLPEGWTIANAIFNDGSNQDPGSNQPGVACTKGLSVVYENGVVTAKGNGTATITATAASGVFATVEVTVTSAVCQHGATEVRNAVSATCEKEGYTGDTICKNCGTMISSGSTIPKAEHKWNAGVVTKEATQTETGVITYTCTICNGTQTGSIPIIVGEEPEDPEEPEDIPGVIVTEKENQEVGDEVFDIAAETSYKITKIKDSNRTVEYVETDSDAATIVILDSIMINGQEYKVTSISKKAFYGNKDLKNITIGANVNTIGEKAFYGCTKLKKVTWGSGLKTIGDKAFYKCSSLTSITIPSKVNKIGKQTFYGCRKLKTLTIKTSKLTNKNVGSNAFKGLASRATIKVPKNKLSAYKTLLKKKGVGSKVKIKKM